MLTELDIQIYKLHKQGVSVTKIHETLGLGSIRLKQIAKSIAKAEMTIEYNHTEFNENYLIIQSVINFNFRIR